MENRLQGGQRTEEKNSRESAGRVTMQKQGRDERRGKKRKQKANRKTENGKRKKMTETNKPEHSEQRGFRKRFFLRESYEKAQNYCHVVHCEFSIVLSIVTCHKRTPTRVYKCHAFSQIRHFVYFLFLSTVLCRHFFVLGFLFLGHRLYFRSHNLKQGQDPARERHKDALRL